MLPNLTYMGAYMCLTCMPCPVYHYPSEEISLSEDLEGQCQPGKKSEGL